MKKIKLTPVESSQIDAVGYDADTKTLAVRFKNRSKTPKPLVVYHYPNVEQAFFDKLMEADSKGKFIGENVVKAKLPFTKLEVE